MDQNESVFEQRPTWDEVSPAQRERLMSHETAVVASDVSPELGVWPGETWAPKPSTAGLACGGVLTVIGIVLIVLVAML
jgi:hypothetical protein